jgi:hypothetical protein
MMNLFLLKIAVAALQAVQIALYFSTRLAWLSAFFVLVHNLRPEKHKTRKWFWILGLLSFTAPALYFIINWLIEFYGFKGSPIPPHEAAIWGGLWVGGLIAAWGWLRYGAPQVNAVLVRFKRSTNLERNTKTDVRDIEKYLPRPMEFDPLKFINLKKGVFLGLDEHKEPCYISFPANNRAPHVQVVGTTGAGKGIALSVMATQFLERGEAVFFLDPKDDEWAPHVLHAAAQRIGKPFYFINLNPPHGHQFDPFKGATKEQIFELFQAGLSLTDRGDASDFYSIGDRREASRAAGMMAKKGLNVAQAYSSLAETMVGGKKFEGRLRELAETPSINAVGGQGVDLEKVIQDGGCVYIVGSMRNDIVKTIQRILLVRLIQLAEQRDRIGGELRPVCIVLDELKYHLSRPALEGLGAARDKRVHLVLAHQSKGDLKDCPKDINPDAVVDAVVENCKIKIAYRVNVPETAEWMAAMSGAIQVDDEMRRVKRNVAQAEIVDPERNIRQAERFLVDTNMLLNLPEGVAVLYGHGQAKFVTIRYLPTQKSREAVQIHVVEGTSPPEAEDAIALNDSTPAATSISLD